MAYIDYTSQVYCNGKRRRDRERTGNAFRKLTTGTVISGRVISLHATLGTGKVILGATGACPRLWVIHNGVSSLVPLPGFDIGFLPESDDDHRTNNKLGQITIDGKVYKWWFNEVEHAVLEMLLIEPNGNVWKARSGYRYEEGCIPKSIWSRKLKLNHKKLIKK